MANCSTVLGSIVFDFSETTATADQVREAIRRFINVYGENATYNTNIDSWGQTNNIVESTLAQEEKSFQFNFEGVGRNSYENNLNWFTDKGNADNSEFNDFIAQFNGFKLGICYQEYEQSRYGSGDFNLTVVNGEFEVERSNVDGTLTFDLFVNEFGGDTEQWEWLTGEVIEE